MNSQRVITGTLAVTSLATFWIMPVAPLTALVALHRTKNTSDWARKVSVAAAILCSVYTVLLCAVIYCLTFAALTGRV